MFNYEKYKNDTGVKVDIDISDIARAWMKGDGIIENLTVDQIHAKGR